MSLSWAGTVNTWQSFMWAFCNTSLFSFVGAERSGTSSSQQVCVECPPLPFLSNFCTLLSSALRAGETSTLIHVSEYSLCLRALMPIDEPAFSFINSTNIFWLQRIQLRQGPAEVSLHIPVLLEAALSLLGSVMVKVHTTLPQTSTVWLPASVALPISLPLSFPHIYCMNVNDKKLST